MSRIRGVVLMGLSLMILGIAFQTSQAAQPYGGERPGAGAGIAEPPPIPPAPPKANDDSDYYGVGYVAPWQPASGVHWRRNARVEYYARPPAPTWRWFTTGRGCGYDKGTVYGVTYPQIPTYPYGK